tara:strand:- start:1334 stop:1663 length:330 start_codon:yes stop_codon:yes gene_type:complete
MVLLRAFSVWFTLSFERYVTTNTGGDRRARTADRILAKHLLSQLSYIPEFFGAGQSHQLTVSAIPSDIHTIDIAEQKSPLTPYPCIENTLAGGEGFEPSITESESVALT